MRVKLTVLTILYAITISAIAQKSTPNVLFIICDDLNDYQGIFGGHPQAKTPNIDKLAASGVQFVNAQSNIPVCQPSRNSLFTGVYPHQSKDFAWTSRYKQPVLKNNKSLMQLFNENGYKTLGTGKLDHGNNVQDWQEWGMNIKHNYGPTYFDGEKVGPHPSVPAPYNKIGPVDGSFGRLSTVKSEGKKTGEKGWIYGWDKKPMRYINDNDRDLLQDEKHVKWAIAKLTELESSKEPFFMGVGFVRPHTPLHAPDKYFDMFPLEGLELAPWMIDDVDDTYWLENFNPKKKGPRYYKQLIASYNGDRELALKHFLQAYLACVAFIDDQVGKLINHLENSTLNDNTIVVFTADHGWQMGEKDYLFKNSPWEESTRIPMIIKAPENNSGKVTQPISLIDIFPTMVDVCHLEGSNKKNEAGGTLGGYSLKPFFTNSKANWQGPSGALSIVGNIGKNTTLEQQHISYRTEQYRYIRYGNGKQELYNHNNDPHEWYNIANEKKFEKLIQKFEKEINEIITTR
ncbi:hypothetical protein KH5_15890 [Urechidicola sp. KH5]